MKASKGAKVAVEGKGAYKGQATATFTIAKASKKALGKAVAVKAAKKTAKASKLKKKAQTVAGAVKVTKDVPKALADFINSVPESNAYDDFAYWDDMLIKAYGERKFTTFSTDEEQIYGGKA